MTNMGPVRVCIGSVAHISSVKKMQGNMMERAIKRHQITCDALVENKLNTKYAIEFVKQKYI